MTGWLIIAGATIAAVAVVRWSLKGSALGGYSAADQTAVKRSQMDIRVNGQHDKERRERGRWRCG